MLGHTSIRMSLIMDMASAFSILTNRARLCPILAMAFLLQALLSPAVLAQAPAPLRIAPEAASFSLAPHIAFFEDPEGQLTLQEVAGPERAAAFQPAAAGAEINFGYSASAYWLRFTLAPRMESPSDWLLEVAFPSLDRIEFHAPAGDGWQSATAGDLEPFAARPMAHRNFVFPLHLDGGQPHTFYLRIASAGSLTVPLRLWQPEAFALHNQTAYAALALYYGMLLALLLYNLLLYFSIGDRNYLTYVLFVASMAVGQLSYNGLGNQFLWPDWPAWGNVAFPAGFAATGFFGALFTRGFLDTPRNAPHFDRLVLGLAVFFALSALAPVLISYRAGAILTSLTGAIFSVVAVAAGIRCLQRDQAGARYFLLAWSLLLVGVAILGLRNLGWLPTNFFTSFTMQIGSALEMLLLSFALADRINGLRRDKERAQADALRIKQNLVEALQDSERQLELRVTARTAELKEANRKLQNAAHHDPLTGLANRLLLDDRLEHAITKAARGDRAMAILLLDLDNFKQVNDQYGHGAGDELLKAASRRLQKSVRAADTVARIGGDEFAIVLEELQSAVNVWPVAEKIITEITAPVLVDDQELMVTISIGIALFPGHGATIRELLKHADEALYAAKKQGRNRFCFHAG